MIAKWDIEMADKCELPKLINGICERCRDYAYCHRPIKLFEEEENENLEKRCDSLKADCDTFQDSK